MVGKAGVLSKRTTQGSPRSTANTIWMHLFENTQEIVDSGPASVEIRGALGRLCRGWPALRRTSPNFGRFPAKFADSGRIHAEVVEFVPNSVARTESGGTLSILLVVGQVSDGFGHKFFRGKPLLGRHRRRFGIAQSTSGRIRLNSVRLRPHLGDVGRDCTDSEQNWVGFDQVWAPPRFGLRPNFCWPPAPT